MCRAFLTLFRILSGQSWVSRKPLQIKRQNDCQNERRGGGERRGGERRREEGEEEGGEMVMVMREG